VSSREKLSVAKLKVNEKWPFLRAPACIICVSDTCITLLVFVGAKNSEGYSDDIQRDEIDGTYRVIFFETVLEKNPISERFSGPEKV
jgi:hypothetical protein